MNSKKIKFLFSNFLLPAALFCLASTLAQAEVVGSVNTEFKVLGPDHKIMIEVFDDPDIANVTCYISRAKTGGIKGGLGLAEDTANADISCQQVGPVTIPATIKPGSNNGATVFRKRTSLIFKSLQVVRFYDNKRNTLIYLAYSDKLISGSPKNMLSTVPIKPW